MTRAALFVALCLGTVCLSRAESPEAPIVRGFTNRVGLASAYDAILNADFDSVSGRLTSTCPHAPVFCAVVPTVSLLWQITLDPDDRRHDTHFQQLANHAIAEAEGWTTREPGRAEAWFARGAAYGARAQWRVLREERLAAARDGKQIKEALERALSIDPELHDAKFGVGMYRYYADIAPPGMRLLRRILLLPDGNRAAGLRQINEAREHGSVTRGEAEYQLHLIYLWYEQRSRDALALVHGLQARYPRNPLFYLIEAEIHDEYFHDLSASRRALDDLLTRANSKRVNAPSIAARRATTALARLDRRTGRD